MSYSFSYTAIPSGPRTLLNYITSFGVNENSQNDGSSIWNSGRESLPLTHHLSGNTYFTRQNRVKIIQGDGSVDGLDWAIFNFDVDSNGDYDGYSGSHAYFAGENTVSGGTGGLGSGYYGIIWGWGNNQWNKLFQMDLPGSGYSHQYTAWWNAGNQVASGNGKYTAYDALSITHIGFSVQMDTTTTPSLSLGSSALYTFTGHTFTNAGATGRTGPALSTVRSAYSSASWAQDTTNNYLNMTGDNGIQLWKVPATGSYTIRAVGAGGGNTISGSNIGGRGIDISTTTTLNNGEIIQILVGQYGLSAVSGGDCSPGGGGGTFIVRGSQTPIIVAGGGGGANDQYGGNLNGGDGLTGTSGGGGVGGLSPGVNGNAATITGSSGSGYGGAGGGIYSSGINGTYGTEIPGSGFVQGGYGGNPRGGFGGGGNGYGYFPGGSGQSQFGGGGAGGYSGGAGGGGGVASGGGGSYAISTMTTNGYNIGHGYVTITPNFTITTSSDLYSFTSHTFTNAGATGRTGPALSTVRSAYSSASWAQDTTNNYLNMTGDNGIQLWKVPKSGNYTIRAAGAAGGNPGTYSKGIDISTTTSLVQGEVIKILVGQMGTSNYYGPGFTSGGGGGTFVVRDTQTAVLVAGGGGGRGKDGDYINANASSSTSGNKAGDGYSNNANGGTNGSGGFMGYGSGGGGLTGNGIGDVYREPGLSFINGGAGGDYQYKTLYQGGEGGFGGGGGAYGNGGGSGGGGYSGGGGGDYSYTNLQYQNGGGGGSYAISTMTTNGYNNGHGYVTITFVSVSSSVAPTLSWSNITKNFNDSAFTITAPTSNSGGSFSYSSSNTSVATISGTTVTIVAAGTSTITATQAASGNYTSGSTTTTLTVNAIAPSFNTFSAITKNFNDSAFTVSASSNSSGSFTYVSNNTGIATISGTTVTIVAAGSTTITANQAASGNYTSGSTTTTLTVNAIAPTITNFNMPAKYFGDPSFSIITKSHIDFYVRTGDSDWQTRIVNNDTSYTNIQYWSPDQQWYDTNYAPQNEIALQFRFYAAYVTTYYNITSGSASALFGNGNMGTYSFTYNGGTSYTGTFTGYNVGAQTWNYSLPITVYRNTLVPTSNSSGSFTYASSNTSVATISGNSIIIVGGGATTITASQAASGNYTSGSTSALLTVSPISPTFSWTNITKNFGDAPFTISASSNSSGTIIYSSNNTAVATISGTTVTIAGAGSSTISAIQDATSNYSNATSSITLTVNAVAPTLTNFIIPAKNFGDSSFNLISPISDSNGAFTYSSSNTDVATIASGIQRKKWIVTKLANAYYDANFTLASNSSAVSLHFNIRYNEGRTILATYDGSNWIYGMDIYDIHTLPNPSTIVISFDTTQWLIEYVVSGDRKQILFSNVLNVSTLAGINNTPSGSYASYARVSSPTIENYGTVTVVGGGSSTITASQPLTTNHTSGSTTATLTVSPIAPTLSNFSIATKNFGDATFTITPPTSNSSGSFTYTSSNTSVATITNSDIFNSVVVTLPLARTAIHNLIGQNLKLLYQYVGSSMSASAFHTACDNQGPTLTVVKESNGAIALAYASASWTSINNYVNLTSGTCWLCPFQTSDSANPNTTLYYNTIYPQYSMYDSSNHGPTFGNGFDLTISSTCYTNFSGSGYQAPPNGLFNNGTTGGQIPFTLASFEVYRLGNGTSGTSIAILGAGSTTITAIQASTTNYTTGTTTTTLTVNPVAAIFNTFSNIVKILGESAFRVTATSSNSSGAITYSSNNGSVASISDTNLVTLIGVGTATITATIAATTNHLSGSTSMTLTVNTNVPTIGPISTSELANKTFGNSSFTITQPTSNSAGAFTYSSSNTSVASLSGNTVTIVGAGSTTIIATQAASGNYLSASVNETLSVAKAIPTFSTFSNITVLYTDAPFRVTATTIASNSPGQFSYLIANPAIATISDTNLFTIQSTGTTTITARIAETSNYLTADTTATLTVNTSNPTIGSLTLPSKTFGDIPFTITQPSSNSPGEFTYTSSNTSVAILVNSGENLYSIINPSIPTLSLNNFPVLGLMSNWEMNIRFNTTGGANTWRPLIGDMYNTVNTRGWGLWVSNSNAIVFSWTSNTIVWYTSINVALNTDYILKINRTPTSLTMLLTNVSTSATQTDTNTAMSNTSLYVMSTNGPVTIGGWINNSGENFNGTISYVNVSNLSVSSLNIVGAGSTTITATQAATSNFNIGSVSNTLSVDRATTSVTAIPLPIKKVGDPQFSFSASTSNNTETAIVYSSSNTSVATVSGTNITIVGGGLTAILASQVQTANYTSGTISTTFIVIGLDAEYPSVNLYGANLAYSNFFSANFTNGNLATANLYYANLFDCDMVNADLSGTNLEGVISGNIRGTPILPASYSLINGYIIGPKVSLQNANLVSQSITNANLFMANLENATLVNGNFTNTNLISVNLTNANIYGTNLANANIASSILNGIISGQITGTPILPINYLLIKGFIAGQNVNLSGVNLTNLNYPKIVYNAFDDFISGPTAQSTNNDWQYFEVNSDRSNATLLSNWQSGGNDVISGYGQWDNNRAFGSYPYVQKVATSGLINSGYGVTFTGPALVMHPDDSSTYNVGMGFKNSTGSTINVTVDISLSLLYPADNSDGLNYFIQRGLINDNRYVSYISSSIPSKSSSTFTFNKSNIELQSEEFIYLILNRNSNFGYDFTRVVFNVSVNNFRSVNLSNVNFTNSNLSGTNFANADLTNATFSGGNLTNSILANTNLTNTNLGTTIMNGVISSGITGIPASLPSNYSTISGYIIGPYVNLSSTNLGSINITNSNIFGSNITNAIMSGITLNGVISGSIIGIPSSLPTNYNLITGYIVGPYVNLTNANVYNSNFTNANILGATVNNINLSNATLNGLISGQLTGLPFALPTNYITVSGYFIGPNVNLTNASLTGADLTNANIYGATVTNASMSGTNLIGLVSGELIGTPSSLPSDYSTISGYIIGPRVNLTDANLITSNLTNSNIFGATVTNAILLNSTLNGLISGSLSGVPLSLPANYTPISGYIVGPFVNLTSAVLTTSNFTNSNIYGATITNASMSNTNLYGLISGQLVGTPLSLTTGYSVNTGYIIGPSVNLTNAGLANSNVTNANLQGATITNTNLSNATLNGLISGALIGSTTLLPSNYKLIDGFIIGPSVNLTNANLINSNLQNQNIYGATITGANLLNSDIVGLSSGEIIGDPSALPTAYSKISGYIIGPYVNLSSALLTTANLTNANIYAVSLQNAVMTNADLTGVISGSITGTPNSLPTNYTTIDGYIIGPRVNLTAAVLATSNLTNANIYAATVTNANLSSAVLNNIISGAINGLTNKLPLDYSIISGYIIGPKVNLTSAVLTNANLTNSNIHGATITNSVLTNTNLDNVITGELVGSTSSLPINYQIQLGYLIGPYVNLVNAFLSTANLVNANIFGANLINANLITANMTHANINASQITNIHLTNAKLNNVISGELSGETPFLPQYYEINTGYIIGPFANLSGADLSSSDLTNSNIYGCNLNDVNLSNAILDNLVSGQNNNSLQLVLPTNYNIISGYIIGPNVNLTGANLFGSNLTNANVYSANITNTNFSNSIFNGLISGNIITVPSQLPNQYSIKLGYIVGPFVSLISANLQNVNLTNANIIGIDISGANFSNVIFNGISSGSIIGNAASITTNYSIINGYIVGPYVNLFNSNLNGADLTNFLLTNSNMRSSNLAYTTLTNTDLQSADLYDVKSGSITGTPLFPTSFSLVNGYIIGPNVNLNGANLVGANLTNVTLMNANMINSDISSAIIINAQLDGANLINANIFGANLYNTTFISSNLHASNLENTYIINTNFTNADIENAEIQNISFTNIQKLQLQKNINNRDITEIQITTVPSQDIISQIPDEIVEDLPDLSETSITVLVPVNGVVNVSSLSGGAFYIPSSSNEQLIIGNRTFASNGNEIRDTITNEVVTCLKINNKLFKLVPGSLIGIEVELDSSYQLNGLGLNTILDANNNNSKWINNYGNIYTNYTNIGVGVINPSYKIHTSGQVGATGYVTTSDQRLKSNVHTIDDNSALNIIRLLSPKTYEYIDKVNNKSDTVYGFLAQEVSQVLPYSVDTISNFIPNLYTNVIIGDNVVYCIDRDIEFIIKNPNSVIYIKIYKSNQEIICRVANVINNRTFTIIEQLEDGPYLLYGQMVDDFQTLKKDAIFTVSVAAMQEIDRIQSNLVSELINCRLKNQELRTRLTNLETIIGNLIQK